jgi:hypothetical protein
VKTRRPALHPGSDSAKRDRNRRARQIKLLNLLADGIGPCAANRLHRCQRPHHLVGAGAAASPEVVAEARDARWRTAMRCRGFRRGMAPRRRKSSAFGAAAKAPPQAVSCRLGNRRRRNRSRRRGRRATGCGGRGPRRNRCRARRAQARRQRFAAVLASEKGAEATGLGAVGRRSNGRGRSPAWARLALGAAGAAGRRLGGGWRCLQARLPPSRRAFALAWLPKTPVTSSGTSMRFWSVAPGQPTGADAPPAPAAEAESIKANRRGRRSPRTCPSASSRRNCAKGIRTAPVRN